MDFSFSFHVRRCWELEIDNAILSVCTWLIFHTIHGINTNELHDNLEIIMRLDWPQPYHIK